MSVHQRPDGTWYVKYRVGGRGTKQREKTTGKGTSGKRDAVELDLKVKREKRVGGLVDLTAGSQALSDFIPGWWDRAAGRLEPKTQRGYRSLITRHIDPHLGGHQLRQLTPGLIQDWVDEVATETGVVTARKALFLLQKMLRRAVQSGNLAANPCTEVERPHAQEQSHAIRPDRIVPVEKIETMRSDMVALGRMGDAVLVLVLAYAGLRPQEALALEWGDVGEHSIVVDKRLTFSGKRKSTKTRRSRTVFKALTPLFADLREWRLACGMPKDSEPVFVRQDGKPFAYTDYDNWRKRVYQIAAGNVGLDQRKPYDLRHTFASLLLADGYSLVEVAEELGHTPKVCSDTYAHVVKDLRAPGERLSAADQIRAARGEAQVDTG